MAAPLHSFTAVCAGRSAFSLSRVSSIPPPRVGHPFCSDYRHNGKAEVTMAEPKHIIKPPNAPLGAVKLRQELGVLVGLPDNVPEEVKEYRGQSGLGDTFEGPRARRIRKGRNLRARAARQAKAKKAKGKGKKK